MKILTLLLFILINLPSKILADDIALFPISKEANYPNPDQISFMDRAGNIVMKGPYCATGRFSDGLAVTATICNNPKRNQSHEDLELNFIDKTGAVVLTIRADLYFDGTWPAYSSGLINIERSGKCGYVDREGKIRIPFTFVICQPFADGVAHVSNGQRWLFIEPSGRETKPFGFKYGFFYGCRQDICLFEDTKKKFFYFNRLTKKRIPGKFTAGGMFSEGLAPVSKGKKWGYIDSKGNLAIPYKYDFASPFSYGMAYVRRPHSSYSYFIDKTQKRLHEGDFESPFEPENGLFYARRKQLGACYFDLKFQPVLCQKNLP